MTDYQCYPLWDIGETGPDNIDPGLLPISEPLAEALLAWASDFDGILNWDYPPNSGFSTQQEEERFVAKGRELATRLQAELGSRGAVVYFNQTTGKTEAVPLMGSSSSESAT